jgi:hypothetical protein
LIGGKVFLKGGGQASVFPVNLREERKKKPKITLLVKPIVDPPKEIFRGIGVEVPHKLGGMVSELGKHLGEDLKNLGTPP